MHAVFFIPYVEPQCRSECWVDVNHDSDLIWIPPDLFSLSQKTCSLARRVFLLLSLCCHAYRLPSPCTVMAGAIQPAWLSLDLDLQSTHDAFLELRASERSYDAFLELRASEHSYDAFLSLPHP